MAAEAEIVVPRNQHFFVNGPVDFMAGGASFADPFVFPNKRPALLLVALEAGLVDAMKRGRGPGPDFFSVRTMTIRAAHFSF